MLRGLLCCEALRRPHFSEGTKKERNIIPFAKPVAPWLQQPIFTTASLEGLREIERRCILPFRAGFDRSKLSRLKTRNSTAFPLSFSAVCSNDLGEWL